MPIFSFRQMSYIFVLILFLMTPYLLNSLTNEFVVESSIWKMSRRTLITEQPQLVFIGSSRFYSGVRPDFLPESAVVLSLPFMNSIHLYDIVKANIDSLLKAKKVFLEVSPEGLKIDSLKLFSGQKKRLQRLGVAIDPDYASLLDYDKRSFSFLFPDLLSFRWNPNSVEYRFFTERSDPLDHLEPYGFLPQNFKKNLLKSSEEWRKLVVGNISESQLAIQNQVAFKKTSELMRAKGIEFFFVLMPVASNYEKWQREYFQDFYLNTLSEPEISKRLLDLMGVVGDEQFADSNHLSPDGARELTEELAQRL